MIEIDYKKWQEVTSKLTQKGLRCERVGPACFSILGNNKVITLTIWEGTWFFQTMGALGYQAQQNANVVELCYECLYSSGFRMSQIPQELVTKYSLRQLSDAEFALADASFELDDDI